MRLGSRGTLFNRNYNIDFSIFGAVLRKFYFKLRYCGFTKPSGFAVFRNFQVILMRFVVFLCYSVRCL